MASNETYIYDVIINKRKVGAPEKTLKPSVYSTYRHAQERHCHLLHQLKSQTIAIDRRNIQCIRVINDIINKKIRVIQLISCVKFLFALIRTLQVSNYLIPLRPGSTPISVLKVVIWKFTPMMIFR